MLGSLSCKLCIEFVLRQYFRAFVEGDVWVDPILSAFCLFRLLRVHLIQLRPDMGDHTLP